jgi:hypothetical protein
VRRPLACLPFLLLAACSGDRDLVAGDPIAHHEHLDSSAFFWNGDEAGPTRASDQAGAPPGTFEPGRAYTAFPSASVVFQEVLPSWNVEVPDGGSFTVDVQVGDEVSTSPWLRIGEWGRVHEDGGLTEFDGGRVAIDVFEGERDFSRLGFRIVAHGAPVRLHDFHAVLTDRKGGQDPTTSRGSAAGVRFERTFPSRSQRVEDPAIAGRICSPTSVAMVLASKGVDLPTAEVAAALHDPRHDIYGNWGRAVQGASTLGVRGYLTRISNWQQVRQHLFDLEPLVISIAYEDGELTGAPMDRTNGHLIVVCGLDGEGGVICRDPAADDAASVPRVYAADELERIWMGGNGVAYVLTDRID